MQKSYLFDWDNNILHMDTRIVMEKRSGTGWKKVKVSTSTFAKIRNASDYRPPNGDWKVAFQEFTDGGQRGDTAFLLDVVNAIKKNKLGPSYQDFLECLTEANFFGIVTARGHKERVMIEAIKYLISQKFSASRMKQMLNNVRVKYIPTELHSVLTSDMALDRYLKKCHFYCVSSERFIENIKNSNLPVEEAKQLAVKMFIGKAINLSTDKLSLGFSDDDAQNVQYITELIEKELKVAYPGVNFNVYDTSGNKKVRRI